MNNKKSPKSGFTIVELLIVIVVIAILASISIVAYNGIQARAEKTITVAAATNARTALMAYQAINGQHPSTSTVCLGSGYVNRAGDSKADCRWNSGNVNPSDSFNAELAKVASISASISQKPVMNGSAGVVGGVLYE